MGRFHVLQEFDEGKRSCRRRLAGHNKRRRKTHPDNVVNGGSLNDERSSSYLLISLLRILSNMHCKYLICWFLLFCFTKMTEIGCVDGITAIVLFCTYDYIWNYWGLLAHGLPSYTPLPLCQKMLYEFLTDSHVQTFREGYCFN